MEKVLCKDRDRQKAVCPTHVYEDGLVLLV
jgi:hypothetical protein